MYRPAHAELAGRRPGTIAILVWVCLSVCVCIKKLKERERNTRTILYSSILKLFNISETQVISEVKRKVIRNLIGEITSGKELISRHLDTVVRNSLRIFRSHPRKSWHLSRTCSNHRRTCDGKVCFWLNSNPSMIRTVIADAWLPHANIFVLHHLSETG